MQRYVGSKLILVEGLTGSGKSIMAHFIARQLQNHNIPASWVHEGEEPHPILMDVESSIEEYMDKVRARWAAYVDQVGLSNEVKVVEACFFNNLIETLLAYNVDRQGILQYSDELQGLIEPLNPILVYLVQEDVDRALERNFRNRGSEFRDFVIRYATETPIARQRGWEGYEGMVSFWKEFVDVTDELFRRHRIRKVKIDTTKGDWDDYNRQVMECLGVSMIPERGISESEAMRLVGVYKDRRNGKEFTVKYEGGELTISLFSSVRTGLVRGTANAFLTEGWHFEVSFETDSLSGTNVMRIDGKDVDYLQLAGTIADKVHV